MAHYQMVGITTDPSHGTVVDPRFAYIVPDDEMAQGSTIGAPRCCIMIKPSGAIQKVYSPDAGYDLFGAVAVGHWDRRSKIRLERNRGEFHVHPERQDHVFSLDNGVRVHEQIFPFNQIWTGPEGIPPPAVYYRVHYTNEGLEPVSFDVYGFAELRGNTPQDVVAEYDPALGGIVAWNRSNPSLLRLFATFGMHDGWEVTTDRAKVVWPISPGPAANAVVSTSCDPVGVLHVAIDLKPCESRWIDFLCVLSPHSREDLAQARGRCCDGAEAHRRTNDYYWQFLRRSVLRTPSQDVNRGVLWAKANMIRVETYAPTGWCFTNDPTRSNNSVGRDTAWMAIGADYVNHDFGREALSAYFRLQQPSGKIVEYYDVRNDKSEDYGLNVNDNTPLVVIALWHHYAVTGNEEFLRECYPKAIRAMDYMLSQRNEQGLVWCTATGTADWGIVGWRNVIENYRISGASTEVNSECCAGLLSLSKIAKTLGDGANAAKYGKAYEDLKDAVNTHLVNPKTNLYYLNIDVDGSPRSDITADLVFPVLFGVAPPERAAKIVTTLSDSAFWTDGGIRTIPRDDLSYGPVNGYGLLGGVWVAVTYWYAFAAAKYNPGFMAHALETSFRHFSSDPRRNNTVPGQFSEWLHGEILVNQGMMLSPWDAPRYLWAAIEGAAGLNLYGPEDSIDPALAENWRWLTATNVPFRGGWISWIACLMPEGLTVFTSSALTSKAKIDRFARDVTESVRVAHPAATVVAFASDDRTLVFIGNAGDRSIMTAAAINSLPLDEHTVRVFTTVLDVWESFGRLPRQAILDGLPVIIDAHGFALLEIGPP